MIGRLLDVAPYAAGYIAAALILILLACVLVSSAGELTEAEDYEGRHSDEA